MTRDEQPSEQQQFARQLFRSAAALAAGGILLVLSGTFLGSGGPSLTVMSVLGLLMLALGAACFWYAGRLGGRA